MIGAVLRVALAVVLLTAGWSDVARAQADEPIPGPEPAGPDSTPSVTLEADPREEIERLAVVVGAEPDSAAAARLALTDLSWELFAKGMISLALEANRHARDGVPLSSLSHFDLTLAGALHLEAGEPDSARAFFDRALVLATTPGDSADALLHAAALQKRIGRPDSALSVLRNAAETAARARDDPELLLLDIDKMLGESYDDLGQGDSAATHYARALELAVGLDDPWTEAILRNDLGVLHRRAGRIEPALQEYRAALEQHRLDEDLASESLVLLNMGLAFGDAGRADSARQYLEASLRLRRRLGDELAIAESLRHLGNLAHWGGETGDLDRAREYYREAARILERVAEDAERDEDRVSLLAIRDHLTIYDDWTEAWLESGEPDAPFRALAVVERGRARSLETMLRGGAAETGSTDDPVERVRRLRDEDRTAWIYHLSDRAFTAWFLHGDGIVRVRRCPVGRTWIEERVHRIREARVSRERMVARLVRGLETPATRGSGIVVRDNRIRRPDREGIDTDPRCDAALERADPAEALALLVSPEEPLKAGTEVLIVPDGPLWLLPFALLPTTGGDELLGTRHALRLLPSLELEGKAIADRKTAEMQALVVADPDMPIEDERGNSLALAPLEGAREEGEWVARRFTTESLTGSRATKAAVLGRIGAADVVHLATHGIAYGSPARARASFVALAPAGEDAGLLTAADILDRRTFPDLRAELVVLSACQTGLGDVHNAEGTVGLARSFLGRGAQGVVTTLWSVSDRETFELMRDFYEAWLSSDRPSVAEALRRARERSRARGARHWAAFRLVGVL